ncbi:DNA-directed RNA polymerase III subunit RPC8 [Portunus trituberculatus]|uniref:DNA-directed RNA polymerase III subunit RPC8 n=1 Tax=Portunus trituberculatus TaxID=210409 RepID=A0A5B7ELX5_PORTR|nr:DNA-directed RNA polymerase III subunit RPC8 [Portunus trituberculatus]
MAGGGRIRFKVVAEQFLDTTPTGPNLAAGDSAVSDRKEGKIPYIVYGAINDQGLGLVSWWTNAEEEQEEEEVEEGEEAL